MLSRELIRERNQLKLIQNHHLEALNARDNPSGVLLCQRNGNGFRWRRRYLLNGRIITVDLRKTDRQLAEKLAVNLYRMVSIEYVQKLINSVDKLIKAFCLETHVTTNVGIVSGDYSFEHLKIRSGLRSEEEPQLPNELTNELTNELSNELSNELLQSNLLAELSIHDLMHKVRNIPRVPADFFDLQSPYRQFIISHLEKEYEWIINWYLSDFKQNTDHPENLQFPVKLGFKVRSKSEVLEANRLYEEGILFHYEELVLLSGEESYPYFYIPITIIEKYIWEHYGAMDKEGYFHRTRGRILKNLDNQWFPGINMITTYETRQHPLTEEQVDLRICWLKSRYRLAFPDLPPDESFNLYDLAAIVKYRRS